MTTETPHEQAAEAAASVETPEQTAEAAERACVMAALANTDPDAEPVKIKSAYRDLCAKMSGPECYRRVRYPHQTSGTEWPDSERLPRRGSLAGDRRCSVYCEVPPGTIVVDFERQIYKGQGGKCKVTIGVAYRDPSGKGKIEWCEHRTLRSRPVYEVTLPDGRKIEVERRED